MIVLGLTGSIGMGKSSTAEMFRAADIPGYDADAEVHRLYEKGGAAIAPLTERFGAVTDDTGAIDRVRLREKVVDDADAFADLERIIHPLVADCQRRFRETAIESGARLVVLDIPLLFETGGDRACDFVAVVSAPPDVQRQRVLSREGMTQEAFDAILDKQMPDAEKRARADFVISTAFGFDFTRAHVGAIIDMLIRQDEQAEE